MTASSAAQTPPIFLVKEIAAKYQIDYRTVLRALGGGHVRGELARERASTAAAEVSRRMVATAAPQETAVPTTRSKRKKP